MTASRIAVIVTCYNLGRTLLDAIASVTQQTLAASELLIVDDGSTELQTRQVLASLRKQGQRVVSIENRGVSAARNLGIRLTNSPLIVLVDADDVLEPTYLEKAAARLDAEPGLAFVTCGMRSFGLADEVWFPPSPDLIDSLTCGVPHVSSMFRRQVWDTVGGFDETLPAHEELDFWTSVLERGFTGEVLPEVLLRYRVRSDSMYRSAIESERHRALMQRVYRKHLDRLSADVPRLIVAKERFLLEQRDHHDHLVGRKKALEDEVSRLDAEIAATVRDLAEVGEGRVDFGDLRRTSPISPVWGLDRGMPLDRYYIHSFLERHHLAVCGRVLEVKDAGYTRMFGGDRVSRVDVVDIDAGNPHATIVADLTRADRIPSDLYDCVILTQTLGLIFDVPAVLAQVHRILKPGGTLLCTVPASGRISYEPPALDGDYWRFTEASLRELFATEFPLTHFDVVGFGNVLARSAFLYGLAPHELTTRELDEYDPFFPVVYGIWAVKPPHGSQPDVSRAKRAAGRVDAAGMILMYHEIAVQEQDAHHLSVAPDEFRAQMQHLRASGYTVLPLDAFAAALRDQRLPPRAVVVSFDDGYRGVLTHAAPILRELALPATCFVVSGALAREYEFWWDALERVLLSGRPIPISLRLSLPTGDREYVTETPADRERTHDDLAEICYVASADVRQRLIDAVLDWSGIGAGGSHEHRAMSAEDLRALSRAAEVTFGAHTEQHMWLPSQSDAAKRAEIEGSKVRLESICGVPVTAFAYPYGGADRTSVDLVRTAGFTVAVTTEARRVHVGDDLLRLPRLDVGRWPIGSFANSLREALESNADG